MEIQANPSLAIVIPVFNEAQVLPQSLRSLTGLSMDPSDSIIFVDGGSNDQSREIIKEHGYSCITSEAGRAKQMNMGVKKTSSDIILFLHADTLITSSNISNIKKSYIQGYKSGRFDIRLSNNGLTYRIISLFINLRSRLSKISTGDQGIFARRDILNQIGGFEEIPLMEDIALSGQLKHLGGVNCLHDQLTTSSRRWEAYGVIRTILLMWKIRLLYWLGVSPEKLAYMYRKSQ